MVNRESVQKIIRGYLPTADEHLVAALTAEAERLIELAVRDIVRKLVLRQTAHDPVTVTAKIDTKV